MIRLHEISSVEVEVVPEGHLAREDMNEFQTWLDKAIQGGHRTIVLNFASVDTLSSSAIGKILHFKRQCDSWAGDSSSASAARRCFSFSR